MATTKKILTVVLLKSLKFDNKIILFPCFCKTKLFKPMVTFIKSTHDKNLIKV